jgi:hypothetical protein
MFILKSNVFVLSLCIFAHHIEVSPARAEPLEFLSDTTDGNSSLHIGRDLRSTFALAPLTERWSVADFGPPPETVLREAYFARDSTMHCTNAALAFLSMRRLVDANMIVEEDVQFYLLRMYVEACLTPLDSVSDPLGTYARANPQNASMLLYLIGESGMRRLRSSIVFTRPSSGLLCSGTLVWLGRAGAMKLNLVTAAHCLGSIEQASEDSPSIVRLNVSRSIDFQDLFGNRVVFDLAVDEVGLTYDGLRDDIAAIELDGSFDPELIGIDVATGVLDAWKNIYLIGQNRYLSEFRSRRFYRSDGRVDIPPDDATVIAMETGCRAFGQADNILFHNCQTVSGMSGAGVFIYEDGMLRLVGVHSGYREVFDRIGVDFQDMLSTLAGSRSENYATLLGRYSPD